MEGWADVKGYEGLYQVSKSGRVYSLAKRNHTGRFLIPERHYAGYLKVDLCKDGICKKLFIHRLVAIAFLPEFDSKEVVNHMDGCKENNHVENLEWMSSADNTRHFLHGKRTMEEMNEAF